MGATVLITGASSGIGLHIARQLAMAGTPIVLAARDMDELERNAADLRIRFGSAAACVAFDAGDAQSIGSLIERSIALAGADLAGAILAHGVMFDQSDAQSDWRRADEMIDVNFVSVVGLGNLLADYLVRRGGGFICGISSVAGDRGRQSNAIYGASKAGVTAYLAGMRNRLYRSGVAVITIKPGFVDTPMSWGLINRNSPLAGKPDAVAAAVVRAIATRRNEVYTPWIWRWIMAIIRFIPEPIFKRLRL